MANPDRTGGGGLSLQTLAVASAASLTAALVTSRLFAHGTIYVAAVTPVIVAAVSEILNRPANAAAELRRQRRTLVMEARRREAAGVRGEDTAPPSGAPDFALGADADDLGTSNGSGAQSPITIHGRSEHRVHPKVWIATGLAAFAIAIAVLTLPELIFGGAAATKHRTTFFGGGNSSSQPQTTSTTTTTKTQTTTTPATVTETVPAQQSPTQTQTTPTETQTTPTQTQPAPADTGTTTTSPPDTVPLP